MKHYFKYNNGYINVDDENLYITSSGNWSEARKLTEKKLFRPQLKRKALEVLLYPFLICCLWIAYYIYNEDYFGILFVILIYLTVIYFPLRSFLYPKFKIPFSKIEAIEPYEKNSLKISFKNLNNETGSDIVKSVEEKGVVFLLDKNNFVL